MHLDWWRYTHGFTEREYLSSAVNTLTNSLKIIDTTKTEFLELIFLQSYEKILEKTVLQI